MKFCIRCLATMAEGDATVCGAPGCSGTLRPEPLLGESLDRRWRIEKVCGVGGMGVLFRARHLLLGHPFAVKVLQVPPGDATAVEEAVRRFRLEAKLIAGLRHPAIVGVNDFGTAPDGRPFIVMEFLEGGDLADEVLRAGGLAPERIDAVLTEVGEALAWAHGHGVIHRDVKPGNIFLARIGGEEQVKLLDFGVAKLVDALTHAAPTMTSIVGTPHYMAPEQFHPWLAAPAPPTDVYALGGTLYTMACSHPPFADAQSAAEIVRRKRDRDYPRLADIRPGHGWEAVDPVVHRALAPEPAARHPDVPTFLAELHEALAAVRAAAVPAPVACPSCQTPLPPQAAFCPLCGSNLRGR